MSSTLMWIPVINRKGNALPDGLKQILSYKYSLSGSSMSFTHSELDYLNGLKDAGIKGADKLIEAIEQHDVVDVWLQY
jgi:hypothetical protein